MVVCVVFYVPCNLAWLRFGAVHQILTVVTLGVMCLCLVQVQGMSFVAAVLLLNMDVYDAFTCFANLLNRPCQIAFFRLDRNLVSPSCLSLSSPHVVLGIGRISPPRFLTKCLKQRLNQACSLCSNDLVVWVFRVVFSCLYLPVIVFFVCISQLIGCQDRLQNILHSVGISVLWSVTSVFFHHSV